MHCIDRAMMIEPPPFFGNQSIKRKQVDLVQQISVHYDIDI